MDQKEIKNLVKLMGEMVEPKYDKLTYSLHYPLIKFRNFRGKYLLNANLRIILELVEMGYSLDDICKFIDDDSTPSELDSFIKVSKVLGGVDNRLITRFLE